MLIEHKKLIIVLVLACLSISCSSNVGDMFTSIKINNDGELYFRGRITPDNVKKIKHIYKQAEEKPTVLHINSTGGYLISGGKLGDWVHSLNMDVKVMRRCYSSCANYVFPAGRRSLLGARAKLCWHGSFHSKKFNIKGIRRFSEQEIQKKNMEKEKLESLRMREKKFFQFLGVDYKLPIYGESERYVKYHSDLEYDGEYRGFYYSTDDMEKMGIKIVLLEGKWHGDNLDTSNYKKCYKVELSKE